jgi:hypothetical protein
MKKVYIIFVKDLKENRVSVYDVYLNKDKAKFDVDELNDQAEKDNLESEVVYTLESYNVNEEKL